MDGYPNAAEMLMDLERILNEQDTRDLVAYVKLNDAIHNFDESGPNVIQEVRLLAQKLGIEIFIFLDLKLFDVSATLTNVMKKYNLENIRPEILTISSNVAVETLIKLRRLLPNVKLAMVSALTDIGEEEFQARFGMSPAVKIYNDLMNIRRLYDKREDKPTSEPFDLVVCSYHELEFLVTNLPPTYAYIIPGIRDKWMLKKKDEHQKRTAGVKDALDMGAYLVVMGAQLRDGNPEMGITPQESRRLTMEEIKKHFAEKVDPLQLLKDCGGYYCSPKDKEGNFVGPLVAYAGTYADEQGEKKNYVGFEYFNFSQLEENSTGRFEIADLLAEEIDRSDIDFTLLLGAPMGGIMLATELSGALDCRAIFAETKVTALADPINGKKEEKLLVISRHDIRTGDGVVIVEDVCNNFSTTEKLKKIIEEKGGELVGIVCAFNRSGKQEWNGIPVISARYIPTQQWRQDDPEVSQLMSQGNIIWKPKDRWTELKEIMKG